MYDASNIIVHGSNKKESEEGAMSSDLQNNINLRDLVCSIRKGGPDDERALFEIDADVADFIRQDLLEKGKFYNDGQVAYYFNSEDKTLIEIDRSDTELCLVLDEYGLNRSEHIYRYILENLYSSAFKIGQRIEVHRLAYLKIDTFTLYLFNHGNQIYRVSQEAIELVDNGTDGILFISDSKSVPFQINLSNSNGSWLDEIIFSKTNLVSDELSPNERRLILVIWFYALFFENIMPTKPILAFIGERGSGKTTTLRKIGMLLYGERFNVTPLTNDPKDFDAAVTNSALVVFDNADASFKWLDDKLAIAATGGSVQKRVLYTTNKLVDYPIRCFIGISSRTPEFRRDDVADRLLIMKVERWVKFVAEKIILSEVIEHRNEIMSEAVLHIQEILGALRDYWTEIEAVDFRMADFARFALILAKYAGVYPEMEAIFNKLSTEQTDYANEYDPLAELLSEWVSGDKNAGREVTTNELYKELSGCALKRNEEFSHSFGNVQSFGQRLANSLTYLKTIFKITKRKGSARKIYYSLRLYLRSREGA